MKYLLYMHGGSGNKGCEAIVRSTVGILGIKPEDALVASFQPKEDLSVGLDEICTLTNSYQELKKGSFARNFSSSCSLYLKYYYPALKLYYKPFLRQNFHGRVALSVGGDNYCYTGSPYVLRNVHKKIRKECDTSILWGCSITPEYIKGRLAEDLAGYDLITARESLTYNALVSAGLKNVKMCADPAFTLPVQACKLPKNFLEGNTVGINFSPHVLMYAKNREAATSAYLEVLEWILKHTDMNIMLISHVEKEDNSDSSMLSILYEKIKEKDRIAVADAALNCMQTKYLISQCRFFIGARTHATIAAYSSCVPTLVIGYSVKARGIARDLFGTEENYVVQTQSISNQADILHAFQYQMSHEDEIRTNLIQIMPEYINRAEQMKYEVEKLLDRTI